MQSLGPDAAVLQVKNSKGVSALCWAMNLYLDIRTNTQAYFVELCINTRSCQIIKVREDS